jgi:hypothetical protein
VKPLAHVGQLVALERLASEKSAEQKRRYEEEVMAVKSGEIVIGGSWFPDGQPRSLPHFMLHPNEGGGR